MAIFEFDIQYFLYILNKKRNITCIFESCFLGTWMILCKVYFMYKLSEVFTNLKMNITTEASKFMCEDKVDVRKGPNLKMQFKRAF